MKMLLLSLLLVTNAWATGDMIVFSNVISGSANALQAAITAATADRTAAQADCAKVASRPKRDKCNVTALTTFNNAIALAESTFNASTLTGAGVYFGVPATVTAVDAEVARLQAIAFVDAFALQQAKIDACMLANAGSVDPNVCNDLSGY